MAILNILASTVWVVGERGRVCCALKRPSMGLGGIPGDTWGGRGTVGRQERKLGPAGQTSVNFLRRAGWSAVQCPLVGKPVLMSLGEGLLLVKWGERILLWTT